MKHSHSSKFKWGIVCTLILGTIVTAPFHRPGLARAADPAPGAFPQPTTRAVFNEMKGLIPLSLSASRWSGPEERKEIQAGLQRLEDLASELRRHGRDREAGFGELALNLSRDLRDSGEYFKKEQFEESRFFFAGTLQSCVSCHTRLATPQSFPLAAEAHGPRRNRSPHARRKGLAPRHRPPLRRSSRVMGGHA